eukprot:14856671-Ditylum_brightwellii.AAC.1
MAPHKDKNWCEVPPKNNQCKRIHSTKEGPKPVTYYTTCGICHNDSMGGHLVKDHTQYKESLKKFTTRGKNILGLRQLPRPTMQLQRTILLTVRRVPQIQ